MGDGPPWIQKVYKDKPPGGWLDSAPYPHDAAVTFHLELDENKRWGIEAAFERPADNENELTAILARPGEFNLAQSFLEFNDLNPEHAQPVHNVEFGSEDIYVAAYYKAHPNPAEIWKPILPGNAQLFTPDNWKCIIEFDSPAGCKIIVTITFEHERQSF
jgi:hypothetical protein